MTPIRSRANASAVEAQMVDVVVHTHWDREWYMDRETTLCRLEIVMQRVLQDLDANRLDQFLFDGQTVALEDLFSRADPTLTQRIKAQALAGRLILGPWYVASDEFLVCGESLIRNLSLGMAQANALGNVQRIGYLPDTFGHVAQMPQILQQFGIAHAVVWRGADAPTDLFDWQAPDGTTVITVHLSEGYYLHPLHGEDWLPQTQSLLRKLAARRDRRVGGPLLLTHGGDHLAPHPLLKERLLAFNNSQSEFVLRQSSLLAHVRELIPPEVAPDAGNDVQREVERPIIHGELRRNQTAFVLPDVLSTRRYLKRMHQAAEDRLLGRVEPLTVLLDSDRATDAALQRAWRLLLQQQAHDSICGCSIDEVHRQMEQRFEELNRGLDALEARMLQRAGMIALDRHAAHHGAQTTGIELPRKPAAAHIDVFADDSHLTLFNPLPCRREAWWVVQLFLKGPKRQRLRAVDAQGAFIPIEVLDAQAGHELISPLDEFPERLDGHRYLVALHRRMEGLGALRLTVLSEDPPSSPPIATPQEHRSFPREALIDNGAWRAELAADGRLLLTDRRQRSSQARELSIISELDAGDTYNHSPVEGTRPAHARRWMCVAQRHDGPVQELRLHIELQCPQGLDETRRAGATAMVTCNGSLTLRLLGDEPLLRMELSWHNAARDQRTRLVFDGIPAHTAHTWRDTAFAWTAHPITLAKIPAPIGRGEAPVSVQPSLSALVAGPWMLAHRALHEHEIIPTPHSTTSDELALGVTLVRCVGWMSRRDLRTRGVGAGPDLPTPQAQCLGTDHFELLLVAHEDDTPSHQALFHAQALRRPMVALRGHCSRSSTVVDLGDLPLQVCSCRRLPDGQLEIRVWNPTSLPVQLGTMDGPWECIRADGHALPPEEEGARGVVRPHGLLTLRSARIGSGV